MPTDAPLPTVCHWCNGGALPSPDATNRLCAQHIDELFRQVAALRRKRLPRDHYYTPGRIRWCLRNWSLLAALAESPNTSRHQLSLEHEHYDGPCKTSPKVGKSSKGLFADQTKWSDVRADVSRAIESLGRGSLEWRLIQYRLRYHEPMRRTAQRLGLRYQRVLELQRTAIETMVTELGGETRASGGRERAG